MRKIDQHKRQAQDLVKRETERRMKKKLDDDWTGPKGQKGDKGDPGISVSEIEAIVDARLAALGLIP